MLTVCRSFLFFFNDTATTEIYTLSLHDALPICAADGKALQPAFVDQGPGGTRTARILEDRASARLVKRDRKSTRLNSSHGYISYAVFCLKKKKARQTMRDAVQSRIGRDTPTSLA